MATATNSPPWRGIHHVALVTRDLDATAEFYKTVLGMSVGNILTMGTTQKRHCFIRPGDTTSWGLHVFEYTEAEIHPYSDGFTSGFIPGALQHLAFALPSAADGVALRERLLAHGVEVTPINTIGPIQNMLFFDNNGLLLEATW